MKACLAWNTKELAWLSRRCKESSRACWKMCIECPLCVLFPKSIKWTNNLNLNLTIFLPILPQPNLIACRFLKLSRNRTKHYLSMKTIRKQNLSLCIFDQNSATELTFICISELNWDNECNSELMSEHWFRSNKREDEVVCNSSVLAWWSKHRLTQLHRRSIRTSISMVRIS